MGGVDGDGWSERGMEIECEGDGFTGSTQGSQEGDGDSKREWIASLRSGMRRRESQYLRKKEKPMWSSIKTVDGFKRRNPVRTTSRLTKNHRERPRNALRAADEKLSLRAISLKLREVLRVRIVSSKKLTQVSVVQVTITVNHVISVT